MCEQFLSDEFSADVEVELNPQVENRGEMDRGGAVWRVTGKARVGDRPDFDLSFVCQVNGPAEGQWFLEQLSYD